MKEAKKKGKKNTKTSSNCLAKVFIFLLLRLPVFFFTRLEGPECLSSCRLRVFTPPPPGRSWPFNRMVYRVLPNPRTRLVGWPAALNDERPSSRPVGYRVFRLFFLRRFVCARFRLRCRTTGLKRRPLIGSHRFPMEDLSSPSGRAEASQPPTATPSPSPPPPPKKKLGKTR